MAEIYQLPDSNSGNAGMGNIPFSIPIGGFGGGLFGGNYGMNGVFDIFALAIIANMFGWNGGGFGTMPMPKLEEKDFDAEIENKAE